MSHFAPPRTRRLGCLEARRPWNFDPTFGGGRRELRTKWKEFALTGIAIQFSYEVKWKPEVESDLISRSTENGDLPWQPLLTAMGAEASTNQEVPLPPEASPGSGDWGGGHEGARETGKLAIVGLPNNTVWSSTESTHQGSPSPLTRRPPEGNLGWFHLGVSFKYYLTIATTRECTQGINKTGKIKGSLCTIIFSKII